MRCISRATALLAALAFLAAGGAEAATKTYTGSGRASMDAGRKACLEAATRKARKAAVRGAIEKLGGAYREARHGALVADADTFIGKAKVAAKNVGTDGACEVTVKARIDVGRLERAVNRTAAGGAVMAVIVRYLIDGAVADDAGVNELEATNIAMRQLQDFGCRTVSLHEHYRIFSRRLKPQWQAVAGDGSARTEPETESDSEAIGRIKRDLSERLSAMGDDPMGGEALDLILLGEVDVARGGRDPDSERFVAHARIGMSVHRLSTLEQFEATEFTLPGQGANEAAAANRALHAAVMRAVSDINRVSETNRNGSLCEALAAN